MRKLIVNADDLGYTLGVTRGIIRAHKDGIVTSASVTVNMPAAAESVELTRKEAPDLGLGLHLTLTAGPSVASSDLIPDLVKPDGHFHPKAEVTARLGQLDMVQVERELLAQVDRFIELAGKQPDHLDSHHHITYLHPSIMELMLRLASRLAIPIRKPLNDNVSIVAEFVKMLGITAEPKVAASMAGALENKMAAASVKMPDHFISGFFKKQATLGDLLILLANLPEGISEVMCHPAEVDDALVASSSYTTYRQAELDALTHPSVRELIQSEGIELINFGGLEG